MFGLAGGKDAAYSNMSVQNNLSATVMNLARLAVQDIIAQNNLIVRNNVAAGNSLSANQSVNAGGDVSGSTVASQGTIDAGGTMSTAQDIKANDGTLEGNSVLATDDGRFSSIYLDGSQLFLNTFPMPINGSFGYLQSLAVPPAFVAQYVQSYSSYGLGPNQSLSFFVQNIPAGRYILNLSLSDQDGPGGSPALTYILDGVATYCPFSQRQSPFLYFDHPGGLLSLAFATLSDLSGAVPATAMVLSQYTTPTVLDPPFILELIAPVSGTNGTLGLIWPTNLNVVQPPLAQVIRTVQDSVVQPNTFAMVISFLADFSPYLLAQYVDLPASVTVTRTSGGSGTYFVTLYVNLGSLDNRSRQTLCVPIPDENVPVTLNMDSQNHTDRSLAYIQSYTVSVRVDITTTYVSNGYETYTTAPVNFTVSAFNAPMTWLLYA